MSKALVCTCEDVTARDVETAVQKGYRDIESVKRYTGFGTGMCQGKSCHAVVARMLNQCGVPGPAVRPFTSRPPSSPTPLSHWATAPLNLDAPPSGGVPKSLGLSPKVLRPKEPLPTRADVVIIGGGIMGLALAHNLALAGQTDVVVLDRSY